MYAKEFKAEAAAPAEKRERSVVQAAKDLGINDTVSRRRTRQTRESSGVGLPPFSGHGRHRDEELFRTERGKGTQDGSVKLRFT